MSEPKPSMTDSSIRYEVVVQSQTRLRAEVLSNTRNLINHNILLEVLPTIAMW